jgi:hypothetical protein
MYRLRFYTAFRAISVPDRASSDLPGGISRAVRPRMDRETSPESRCRRVEKKQERMQ